MRRQDRARDAAFAWEVFDQAPYGVLCLRDGEGGYGVPISPARIGERVYFHCAMEGKKLDCLAAYPEVAMTAVSSIGPAQFSVNYRSAILRGRAVIVEEEEEKREALRAICQRYCPEQMDGFERCAGSMLKQTCICRVDVAEITAKERTGK